MKCIIAGIVIFVSFSSYAQWDDSFSSQVNSRLKISGSKCVGGEPSGVSHRICEAGQWRIVLNEGGRIKAPFISFLRRADIVTPSTIVFYDIIPRDRVTLRQRVLLRKYWVRFDLNGEPLVMKKNSI